MVYTLAPGPSFECVLTAPFVSGLAAVQTSCGVICRMAIYRFTLPTTGAVSFSDFLSDPSGANLYSSQIAQATQARANLRGALKENKRTESDERNYLNLIKVRCFEDSAKSRFV